jgi:hypothetical protein
MAELVVYDLTGRIISSNNEQLHIGINTISIDLDNIAPGTYVLQMRNGDKQFVSSFIVK